MTAPATQPPVILAVTEPGSDLARRLQAALPGALVHGRVGRVTQADDFFDETTAHAARLFLAGHPVIGVFASGILIRALAPHLADKVAEPPVRPSSRVSVETPFSRPSWLVKTKAWWSERIERPMAAKSRSPSLS